MSIAREGWPFIGTLLGVGLLLAIVRQPWFAAPVLLLGLFTAYFFRDPERKAPADPKAVLSPADGKVILVQPAPEGHPFGPGTMQVSIFLSVFDVHINRAPIAGRISRVQYHPGEFLPAWDDKASLRNEQNAVTVEDGGTSIEFKQIAGLIARRIVFKKHEGDAVAAGERVGMIKFGSRVDVFLPASVKVRARKGERVQGGLSVLAERP